MFKVETIISEIKKIENITLDVQQEIRTLKKTIGAYKGWTTKYRKQREEKRRVETRKYFSLSTKRRSTNRTKNNTTKVIANNRRS